MEEVSAMLKAKSIRETQFYKDVAAEVGPDYLAKGKEQGKLEGRQDAKLELIEKMVQRGFSAKSIADLFELEIGEAKAIIAKIKSN